jgi:L-ascorbate metabolism protein UlaG (beta-lactamase superfamily)
MTVRIRWFPPSWVQIKTKNHVIYIDPAYLSTHFRHYPKKIEFSKWPDPIDGLPEELEKGDVILITHHHKDHCKGVTVNRLRNKKTKVFAPKTCARELGAGITEVKPGMRIETGDIRVETVDAYNVKNPGVKKIVHKKGNGVGYVTTIEGKRIYHAGDTDLIPEMGSIANIDVALLPIGDRNFTMGVPDAVKAAEVLKAKVIIPMHRFESDPNEFKDRVESETPTRVESLEIGGTYEL